MSESKLEFPEILQELQEIQNKRLNNLIGSLSKIGQSSFEKSAPEILKNDSNFWNEIISKENMTNDFLIPELQHSKQKPLFEKIHQSKIIHHDKIQKTSKSTQTESKQDFSTRFSTILDAKDQEIKLLKMQIEKLNQTILNNNNKNFTQRTPALESFRQTNGNSLDLNSKLINELAVKLQQINLFANKYITLAEHKKIVKNLEETLKSNHRKEIYAIKSQMKYAHMVNIKSIKNNLP